MLADYYGFSGRAIANRPDPGTPDQRQVANLGLPTCPTKKSSGIVVQRPELH